MRYYIYIAQRYGFEIQVGGSFGSGIAKMKLGTFSCRGIEHTQDRRESLKSSNAPDYIIEISVFSSIFEKTCANLLHNVG